MAEAWIAAADAGLDKLKELSTSDEGWKADKTKNGVVMHHRYSDDSPIVMMRGAIEIPASAADVLKCTEDLAGRKKWDELFQGGEVIAELDDKHQVLHFKFKSPSMVASNRDFVMARSVRVNDDGSIAANHVSIEHPDCGEQKGYVRGEIDVSGYYIVPTGENSCKCYYVVQLDPKGW
eukprot:CAMPEP_0117036446 /NCGR_PEP_ID=MMETSP0472-20121206/25820_1 /TAXON_ID=693140 ORGANISM="Tiarina fusus, Strain LIS" /NCGR_SAMPLE_ID=MMETSP0472 /ASSEMBLY_ACC=CAM_ASM_000603 /LENGTH=177 /DNA_ID=CAMNT_0004746211 /DNA_START=8 /DNA_END=538 /DNA_ORIENTATION=+